MTTRKQPRLFAAMIALGLLSMGMSGSAWARGDSDGVGRKRDLRCDQGLDCVTDSLLPDIFGYGYSTALTELSGHKVGMAVQRGGNRLQR